MANEADIIIDFRDTLSSISLLKMTHVFGKMKSTDVLEIRGVDSDTLQDVYRLIPVNARQTDDHCDPMADDGRLLQIRIKKI